MSNIYTWGYLSTFIRVSKACSCVGSENKYFAFILCPGLRYALHKAQPVSAVRTQAVVFSLRSDPAFLGVN